jgi:endonuclease/exonuclease/phosphatase family metal-dependent hydrolase
VRRTERLAVPLLAFTPKVASAAPWAALGLRLAGRRRAGATAALAAAALGVIVWSRKIPRPDSGACGPMLRVLTANLYFGRVDAEVIVARVRQGNVDVLCLQELTEDAVTRLKQAGLEDLMPHLQLDLRGGSRGSGIYSRFPLSDGPAVPPVYMAQPTALLRLPDGSEVEVVCVHPVPPAPFRKGGAVAWRRELAVLPPPGELPRVLAGDFNATLDHAAFRDVLRLGYLDAARQAGKALTPTWGPGRNNAVLTLDHVLVDRGCAVLEYSVHFLPGGDHRAVYAEIQLPERRFNVPAARSLGVTAACRHLAGPLGVAASRNLCSGFFVFRVKNCGAALMLGNSRWEERSGGVPW